MLNRCLYLLKECFNIFILEPVFGLLGELLLRQLEERYFKAFSIVGQICFTFPEEAAILSDGDRVTLLAHVDIELDQRLHCFTVDHLVLSILLNQDL